MSVESIISMLFGYHILQIGLEEHQDLISDSPAGHKIMFSSKWSPGLAKPVANCEKLPIASDSIDSIVLYHALDFANDCHELRFSVVGKSSQETRFYYPDNLQEVHNILPPAIGSY